MSKLTDGIKLRAMRRLRAAARALGVSLNTFVVAGLAQTFLDQAPDDPQALA